MSRLRKKDGVEILQENNSPSSRTATERMQTNEGIQNTFGHVGKLIKKLILFFCVLYCLIILLVYISSTIRHQLVYLNYLVNPFVNYTDPAVYQFTRARNFYIQGNDGKLGVWHIPAAGSISIDDGKPVVLYMHGNAYSRVAKHRIATYKVLSALECHVIAHDYRGFGDSDGIPTEQGLTDDSLATFQWILANTNRSPVFLWGHSLGSAVAVAVSKILTETDVSVQGLILEAPFNNMGDAAFNHPLSTPFRFLPFFKDSLQEVNDMFKSDEMISSVKYNILIIHDHEDVIIGINLGKKLYEVALKHQKDNQLIDFKEFRGFGHTKLHASQDLPEILRKFMKLETRIEDEH